MKKLNKRARTTNVMCTVQQYTDICFSAAQEYCSNECRKIGTGNYGMTFPRAEIANANRV